MFVKQVRLMPYAGFRRLGQIKGSDGPPHEGCERLGYDRTVFMMPELQAKMAEAQAAGRSVVPVPTGVIIAPGTKSETVEMAYWSCPKIEVEQESSGNTASTTSSQSVPAHASEPPKTTPFPTPLVAGGLVVAGLAAFLAFSK